MALIASILIAFMYTAFAGTEVYFSPGGGCEAKVVALTNAAKEKIDAAVYSLNNVEIVAALKSAHKRGVKIRLLLDKVQAFGNREAVLGLKEAGLDVRIHSKNKIEHNKFGIFDGKSVVNGSFNWTNSGERANSENCLATDDASVVKKFQDRFTNYLWIVNTSESSDKTFVKLNEKAKAPRSVSSK